MRLVFLMFLLLVFLLLLRLLGNVSNQAHHAPNKVTYFLDMIGSSVLSSCSEICLLS